MQSSTVNSMVFPSVGESVDLHMRGGQQTKGCITVSCTFHELRLIFTFLNGGKAEIKEFPFVNVRIKNNPNFITYE